MRGIGRMMNRVRIGYALALGALAYSGAPFVTETLYGFHGCCSYSSDCWEMHDWDTNYMCCTACSGTQPCTQSSPGYCKDTGGDWCPPCMEE